MLSRVKANWTGLPGGDGVTSLYFEDPADPVAAWNAVGAFFGEATKQSSSGTSGGVVPVGVSISLDTSIEQIDPANGVLMGEVTVTGDPIIVDGTSTGSYAAPTGACISWRTQIIRNGRRVRGRTFLVPLGESAFQSDGTLASAYYTQLKTAASDLIAVAPELVVWSRPTATDAGTTAPILAATVTDQAAILSSRRD